MLVFIIISRQSSFLIWYLNFYLILAPLDEPWNRKLASIQKNTSKTVVLIFLISIFQFNPFSLWKSNFVLVVVHIFCEHAHKSKFSNFAIFKIAVLRKTLNDERGVWLRYIFDFEKSLLRVEVFNRSVEL